MIKSVFKIIWKNKRKNVLLIIQMLISFLILFALSTAIINNIKKYNIPLGFNYDNVWILEFYFEDLGLDNLDITETYNQLKISLASFREIESFSLCSGNIPYTRGEYWSGLRYEGISSGNAKAYFVDDNFADLMQIKIISGRWFKEDDNTDPVTPIVIDNELKSIFFHDEDPIGKIIHSGKYKVIGLIEDYRDKGEFSKSMPGYFVRINSNEYQRYILIKVKEVTGYAFEKKLMENITSIAKKWTIKISKMENLRKISFKTTWIPIYILSGICIFLIINVILGLFGILWYNINIRREEIGLRQALGANIYNIYNQFICEMLALATLSIFPGLIIAAQFPILKVIDIDINIYLAAMLAATLIIYLLVTLCALLPSAQAAKIQPAEALHKE
jgi:putative ABC transport system permease protein